MNKGLWYCGNIVVATFLCLNISFLSATGAPINIPGLDINTARQKLFSYKDVPFNSTLRINNRTVTCSGKAQESHYPSPMYTCHEISVDGKKLYHGYSSDGGRNKQQCNAGCPCGKSEGQSNNIQALCNAMLQVNGVTEDLIAAYVVKPSCNLEKIPANRVKFYLSEDGDSVWEDVHVPNGYINTLQCLTTEKAKS